MHGCELRMEKEGSASEDAELVNRGGEGNNRDSVETERERKGFGRY